MDKCEWLSWIIVSRNEVSSIKRGCFCLLTVDQQPSFHTASTFERPVGGGGGGGGGVKIWNNLNFIFYENDIN